jgi:hypothetical protein
MRSSTDNNDALVAPLSAFTPAALRELVSRIKTSGELGRSKAYGALLDYLAECSINGKSPKEYEIAVDALGKGANFDVTRDSAVRVYIHQLRKKLDNFFEANKTESAYRIVIPKGQYSLAAVSATDSRLRSSTLATLFDKISGNNLSATAIIALLAANLVFMWAYFDNSSDTSVSSDLADSGIWSSLLDDDLPILLVMGDYYIFGELNDNGNIGRMVREFNINSREDLEQQHFDDWESTHNYQDLDLSYMPEGAAYALTKIIPIISSSEKRLNIIMMSDLTTADLRSNHIVYIGYISALDKLSEMVFTASNLVVGRSYDELLDQDSGIYYTSDAGLPEQGQQFRDYGFYSTFPASSESQAVIISGMRDAGLMYTAQALSDQQATENLNLSLDQNSATNNLALEALYEVFGMDRMHFEGRLVYSRQLDASTIWGMH